METIAQKALSPNNPRMALYAEENLTTKKVNFIVLWQGSVVAVTGKLIAPSTWTELLMNPTRETLIF